MSLSLGVRLTFLTVTRPHLSILTKVTTTTLVQLAESLGVVARHLVSVHVVVIHVLLLHPVHEGVGHVSILVHLLTVEDLVADSLMLDWCHEVFP